MNNSNTMEQNHCIKQGSVTKAKEKGTEEQEAGVPENPDHGKYEWLKIRCKWFLKKFLLSLFSHVGLMCVVVCYLIIGACVFEALEAHHELQSRLMMSKLRSNATLRLWEVTDAFNILDHVNWTKRAEEEMLEFQREIFRATKVLGWDGVSDLAESELMWSFTGALLYSVTVITSIGYGHITPKTIEGRIATIIYALFGIPLLLLCLANIGTVLGSAFRVIYWRINEKFCRICKKKIMHTNSFRTTSHGVHVEQYLYEHHIATTAAVATGDEGHKIVMEQMTEARRRQKDVPIAVCLMVFLSYNFLGGVLFSSWEGWDLFSGLYFCFITLSTIGFGDLVPGSNVESWQSNEKRVLCSLYLLIGLALMAMCFDLMQRQVRELFTNIGVNIGLLDENDDGEFDDNLKDCEKNVG